MIHTDIIPYPLEYFLIYLTIPPHHFVHSSPKFNLLLPTSLITCDKRVRLAYSRKVTLRIKLMRLDYILAV